MPTVRRAVGPVVPIPTYPEVPVPPGRRAMFCAEALTICARPAPVKAMLAPAPDKVNAFPAPLAESVVNAPDPCVVAPMVVKFPTPGVVVPIPRGDPHVAF